MKTGRETLGRRPNSLRDEFRRVHLTLILVAIALAGSLLSAIAWAGLRKHSQYNLELIARSLAYTVEASLVFQDREAALEAIATVAQTERLASIKVVDSKGQSFAQWDRPRHGWQSRVARSLWPDTVRLPVVRANRTLGQLEVQGDAMDLVNFLLTVIAIMALCLGITAALALHLGRRMLDRITGPLHTMAEVAHAVRHERDMSRRVPDAAVSELSDLGDDLNALIEEVALREEALRDENAHLAHQARHDTLTGLPNRSAFARALESGLALAKASQGRLAVLFVDCDHFKAINDTLGHAAGDTVLCEVAHRLRARVRDGGQVARLGGDEFAVLLSPLRDGEQARQMTETLRQAMVDPVMLEDGTLVQASVSVGMAVYPEHGATAATLLGHADGAMYHIKRQRAHAA